MPYLKARCMFFYPVSTHMWSLMGQRIYQPGTGESGFGIVSGTQEGILGYQPVLDYSLQPTTYNLQPTTAT